MTIYRQTAVIRLNESSGNKILGFFFAKFLGKNKNCGHSKSTRNYKEKQYSLIKKKHSPSSDRF